MLAKPQTGTWGIFPDEYGGYTISVDQHWYGHQANKPTWLYAVGCDLPALAAGKAPKSDMTVGRSWGGGKRQIQGRAATPAAFRDVLIAMARTAGKVPVGD